MAEEFPSNIPPGNFGEKEFSPQAETPKGNRFLSWLKNILVLLVLIGVVAASFWVSFQLGKKILVPTKKLPERISAANLEPPPSIKSLQKLQALMSAEAGKKIKPAKTAAKAPTRAKIVAKKCAVPKTVAPARISGRGYYKLQAGLLADKAQAEELAGRMKSAGIDVFVKKVGGGWRVQAGAYKTKEMAEITQSALNKKGYKSKIVFE
ncbi:MAG: SPOR domain-containing protein [Candidatus Margulisbacteria bacterium]|nr:SPOR domain-containing protein [Candidatus Margulisiibacteriota bacterium]